MSQLFILTSHYFFKIVKCPSYFCLGAYKMSICISFQRFTKIVFFKNYISGLAFKATDTKYVSHKLYLHTWRRRYQLVSPRLISVHNDIHPTRLNVIQHPSRASQSKTSHPATKKNFWLLAQLFPYQSAKSTSSLLLSISNAWVSAFEAIRTRSV